MNEYTEEQKKDIEERTAKARVLLEELKLQVACYPSMELQNGVYGIKLYPFLQDSKFTSVPSPIQA